MRVLRARGVVGSRGHHQAGARPSQSRARDRGSAAHDVRPEEHAFAAGLTAAGNAFRRQGLPHARAAQRAAGRGAEPRRAGSALGRRIEGRAGLPRARRRNPRAGSARMIKPKGLGRGLDALLGSDEAPREALLTLPVAHIRPGRYQPRTKMDQQALAELAESIRSQRLMQLARPVQEMLMEGALEMGHARALLALDAARQIEAGTRVAAKRLSVRETEALVQTLLRGPAARRRRRTDRDLARLEEEVSERLGTTVEIRAAKKGAGKLVLHYSTLEHLEQLLKRLK